MNDKQTNSIEMKPEFWNKLLTILLKYFAIIIWIIQLTVISHLVRNSSGETKFIIAMNWFVYSGLFMFLLSLISLIKFIQTKEKTYLISLIINLSFLYNLKIVFFGPFGDLFVL